LRYRQDGIFIVSAENDIVESVGGDNDGNLILDIHPNPASEQINFEFYLRNASFVNLGLYSLDGREIAEIENDYLEIGNHYIDFKSANLPSGIYFARLTANGRTIIRNVIIRQ